MDTADTSILEAFLDDTPCDFTWCASQACILHHKDASHKVQGAMSLPGVTANEHWLQGCKRGAVMLCSSNRGKTVAKQ